MIREETIETLKNGGWWDWLIPVTTIEGRNEENKLHEASDISLAALRPITREQVEKVWRGCPECKPSCGLCVNMNAWDRYGKPDVCNRCVDYSNFESDQKFCECCGSPMTDEAVQIVMERLEALKDEQGN